MALYDHTRPTTEDQLAALCEQQRSLIRRQDATIDRLTAQRLQLREACSMLMAGHSLHENFTNSEIKAIRRALAETADDGLAHAEPVDPTTPTEER